MGDSVIPSSPLTPPVPTPPPLEPRHTIFRGPNGMRAGWRVLIFLALVFAIVLAITMPIALLMLVKHGGAIPEAAIGGASLMPSGTVMSAGMLFAIPALAALIMARIERRKFGEYGLPWRSALGKNFWIGGLAGFAAISVCLLGIFALHGVGFTGVAIHGETLISATAAWSVTFVLVGLSEEFAFRGYLQYTLTSGMGFWPAAILLSCVFALAHRSNPGESNYGLLSVVLFGLLFCLFLRRTGNLWWAVGFHAGWDWGQTFFYGVPDSGLRPYHNLFRATFHGPRWLTGGSVGPEASVFTPIVLGMVAWWFTRVHRENRYWFQKAAVRAQGDQENVEVSADLAEL